MEESRAGRREILLSDPSLYLHPARLMRLTSRNGQEIERMHRSNSDDARKQKRGDKRERIRGAKGTEVKGLQN